jgi:transcriptional regulator with XRE-family HTH domain
MQSASPNLRYADSVPPLPHLKTWRERIGLTQAELADRAHVRAATISDIEHRGAQARISTTRALAGALGITVAELLDGPQAKK